MKTVINCNWYNGNPLDLSHIKNKNYGLSLWMNIINMNGVVLGCSKGFIGNGIKIRFWEDTWCSTEKLTDRFPLIYAIAMNKAATVREAAGFDCVFLECPSCEES